LVKVIILEYQYTNVIESNIKSIPVPNETLHKKFNISESKLKKDIRKNEGITLREYILKLKMPCVYKEKIRTPGISNLALMADYNYNYCERSFRNHLKKYVQNLYDDDFSEYYCLSKNREVFLEIFVRFILLAELAKPEINEGRLIINHNVENKIFQFFQFFVPIEILHVYTIYCDIETMKLDYFMLIMRMKELDKKNEKYGYMPNDIEPYFSLLHNIEERVKETQDLSLTECIVDWDKYVRGVHTMTFLGDKSSRLKVDTGNEILRINQDSHFKEYLDFIRELKYQKIKFFIIGLKKLDLQTIDLLIRTICYPYLHDIYIYPYSFYVEDEIVLKGLNKLEVVKFADLIIKFKLDYDKIDEYEDFSLEELLYDLLDDKTLSLEYT